MTATNFDSLSLSNYHLDMQIDWVKCQGLLPAIAQDHSSRAILMFGYMTREALSRTINERRFTLFSRTKKRLWTKGETSGNFLNVLQVKLDCDNDTLLAEVEAVGPSCHRGTSSCFDQGRDFIWQLEGIIHQRLTSKVKASSSYVQKLARQGPVRVAQKVGEEGVEVAIASALGQGQQVKEETADLLFHLLVNLQMQGLNLREVVAILQQRHMQEDRDGFYKKKQGAGGDRGAK